MEDTIKEEPIDDDSMGLSSHAAGPDETGIVTEYWKKTEVGMQDWCLALGCRWEVSDKYFNNPPRPNGASYKCSSFIRLFHWVALLGVTFPLCCDNCLRRRRDDPNHILTKPESNIIALMDRIQTKRRPSTSQESHIIDVDALSIPAEDPKRTGRRCEDRLQCCRDAINEWRSRTWLEKDSNCAWGPSMLLPNTVLTKLATRSHILTVEDIKKELPDWDHFADEQGPAVLELIQKTDIIWNEGHTCELQDKKEIRKRRSTENKELREEERHTKRSKNRAETVRQKNEEAWTNTFVQSVGLGVPLPHLSRGPLPLPPGPQALPYPPSHLPFPPGHFPFPPGPQALPYPPGHLPSPPGHFPFPPGPQALPYPPSHLPFSSGPSASPQSLFSMPGYPVYPQIPYHIGSCIPSDFVIPQNAQNQSREVM